MPPIDKPTPHNPQVDTSESPPVDRSVSRREFARRAALGAASASLLPFRELAAPVYPEPAVREGAENPEGVPKLSPQSQAEADSRYQAILALYPDRFSDAQKTDLKRLCLALQPSLDRLRSWPVSNADQPALYLKPLVEREKKTAAPPNLKSPMPAPKAPAPAAKPSTRPENEKP
jgi:hypothetical protein